MKPPPLPSPHLLSADDEPTGQLACLLRSIRESLVAAIDPQMGTRQWGLIMYPKAHPSGFNDIPAPVASLPYLLQGFCHIVAFWGAYTPLKRSMDMATHMVFIQLRGSHQLVASRAVDMQCYPASTDGDSMKILQALFTRAPLTFHTGTRRSFAVLIYVLHPGSIGRALRRLAPGTLPKCVLQSIHLIRLRDIYHTWNLNASLPSLWATPTDSSSVMKFITLNVQHTGTSKLAPLRHFIEFHEFPELLCHQEIGTASATFRFHPLYEPFFSVGVRKCVGVAILIRRVAKFSYVKSEVWSNGRCVAVWFSMYNTSFLVIGPYLHASGQCEDYGSLLSWAQALVISSPGTWCIVLGDLNRSPGWVTGFPQAPPDISDLFDQFVLDASLTRAKFISVSPTWVLSQGWSNLLDYILLRVPIPPPQAFIHSSSTFPSDHFPVSLSLPLCVSKQEPELWETKRRYHLPEKIPPTMRQRFNMCFAQHIPSHWEINVASERGRRDRALYADSPPPPCRVLAGKCRTMGAEGALRKFCLT